MNPAKNKRNEKIIRLRDKGLSYSQIGSIVGVSKQMVHKICKRNVDVIYIPKVDEKKGKR